MAGAVVSDRAPEASRDAAASLLLLTAARGIVLKWFDPDVTRGEFWDKLFARDRNINFQSVWPAGLKPADFFG